MLPALRAEVGHVGTHDEPIPAQAFSSARKTCFHPQQPATITIMPSTITIDAAGRLVVPLPVRRRLRLVAGSRLRITEGPQSILLEPEHEEARIEEKGGILVVGGRLHGTVPDHRDVRHDRLERLARS